MGNKMRVYGEKTINNRIIAVVICLLLAAVFVMPERAWAQDHKEIVRVGYYENAKKAR